MPLISTDQTRPTEEVSMPQIHLHAEPGDYAPVVLLPGDPNRATRIAARFDGGLEASRLVTEHRGLLGYTGTVDGVPVSVQTTMMGAPTTSIVVEELLMLGATTFIRVGTTGGFPGTAIGDAVIALASAASTGVGHVLGGGEATAPTADFGVVLALVDAAKAKGLTYHVGPIVTGDYFYDPTPGGATRWAKRGYLSAEMEAAALFLICMRERAKGRPVRAGCILNVSDVIRDPDEAARATGHDAWYRPPEDEVTRLSDLIIGAALAAAATLGREAA
jgi:purine-nucleoside phosphorylase